MNHLFFEPGPYFGFNPIPPRSALSSWRPSWCASPAPAETCATKWRWPLSWRTWRETTFAKGIGEKSLVESFKFQIYRGELWLWHAMTHSCWFLFTFLGANSNQVWDTNCLGTVWWVPWKLESLTSKYARNIPFICEETDKPFNMEIHLLTVSTGNKRIETICPESIRIFPVRFAWG